MKRAVKIVLVVLAAASLTGDVSQHRMETAVPSQPNIKSVQL